ncbi:MAG: hypothetical protein NTV68_09915 [Methanomicrobiales archaeon]|nr:hypothetical protein [Methanomicrobiales archaeon]
MSNILAILPKNSGAEKWGVGTGQGDRRNGLIFAIKRPENGGISGWQECREPTPFRAWTCSSSGIPLPETHNRHGHVTFISQKPGHYIVCLTITAKNNESAVFEKSP